jgi:hypothetical protein
MSNESPPSLLIAVGRAPLWVSEAGALVFWAGVGEGVVGTMWAGGIYKFVSGMTQVDVLAGPAISTFLNPAEPAFFGPNAASRLRRLRS